MATSAPTTAIGYTQAPTYSQLQYEDEPTPELQWPQSIQVYDQMRKTDSQCASVLRAVTLPVRRTPWRIDPNGARDEVVEFVADDLGLPIVGKAPKAPPRTKGRLSFSEHLRMALLMLPLGHSYFEQVYRVDGDGNRAHLSKLEWRPSKTIEHIDVAPDGGLISIKQYWTATNTAPKPIPVSRLVAYVNDREGGNWLGQSLLRSCYKNFLLKERLLRVQAQTIERNGMGVPRYTDAENGTEATMAAGKAMATAWRSGAAAGSAIPFGASLDLVGVTGTLPDADPVIRYHDDAIARAVLAHFLNLGTQTGSWALGTTFADFFTLSLQTLAQQIADTATQHIIEDLVDINFGEQEPAPRLVFDEIGSRQAATAQAMKLLVDAGLIKPDQVLDETLRQQYGLPPADPATATVPPAQAAPSRAPEPEPVPGEGSVAVSAETPVAAKFDPSQKRDKDGQWTDGIPGSSGAVDKLKLGKRITLDEGETFIASESGKMSSGGDEYGVPMALINTPEGPRLLLSEETNDDATSWDPGVDSLATLDLGQMREFRDGLDTLATEWSAEQDKARAAGRAFGAARIADRERMTKRPPTAAESAERPGVTHGWDVSYEPPLNAEEQRIEAEYSRYVGADLGNPAASGALTGNIGWALRGIDGDDYGQERLFAHIFIGRPVDGASPEFSSQRSLRGYQERLDSMIRLAQDVEGGTSSVAASRRRAQAPPSRAPEPEPVPGEGSVAASAGDGDPIDVAVTLAEPEPVVAHRPGGIDHDQSAHVRRLPKTGGDGAFSGFTRPQLRDAAKRRGIALEPRESRESIERKLAKHLAAPSAAAPDEAGVRRTRVEKAYADLTQDDPEGWVSLVRLRAHPALAQMSKEEQDQALREMEPLRGVNLEPDANQSRLTLGERRAAVRIGGEDRHLLSIDAPRREKGATKVDETPAPVEVAPTETPVEVARTRVLDAYEKLPKGPAGYVGLADLRDQLADLKRADVDEALRQLSRLPGVHVSPVANRKSLTQRDRDAAVRIGEDENMMISVEEPRKASPEPGADVAPTETPTRMTSAQYTQLLKDENLRLSLLRGMSEKDAKANAGSDASIDDLKKSNASLRARLRNSGIDYRTEEQRNTDDAEKNRLLAEVERLAVASGHDGPAKRAGASKMSRRELAAFVADAQEFQERREAKQKAESKGSAAVSAFNAAEDKSRASKRQVGYIKGLLRQRASSGGESVDGPTSTEDIRKLSNAEARAYINRLLRGEY
jgi:hypothetical protein